MYRNKDSLFVYRALCLATILVGFAIRVHSLGERSLWFDESMEYWVARSLLPDLLATVRRGLQDPPLYSMILHFWLKIGQNEFIMRFLSMIFSMGSILGAIVLSRVSLGRKASIITGALMAVSVPDIRFAQEVGQYALMSLALTWNITFLYLFFKEKTWKWVALWSISGVIGVYSYYGVALTICATALTCLIYTITKRQWSMLLKLVMAGNVYGTLTIPLVIGWLPVQMFRGPTANAFQFTLMSYQEEIQRFITQSKDILVYQLMGYQPNGWPWPSVGQWVVWLPLVLILAISTIRYKFHLLIVWLLASFLTYYCVGRLGLYPFGGRYSLIIATIFWICVAAGVASLLSLSSWRKLLGLSLLLWIISVAFLSPIEPQEDLRSVTRLWLSLWKPGETTYVYYGAVPGFRYQLELLGISEKVPPLWYLDCWQGKTANYCSNNGIFYGRWFRHLSPEQKKNIIFEAIGSPDLFWMIFSHIHHKENESVLSALEGTYAVTMSYFAENSALFLLKRR